MRPGYATLISALLTIAALGYAPTWAVATLAGMTVVAGVIDVARYRQDRHTTDH